jgi:hypothetical protein
VSSVISINVTRVRSEWVYQALPGHLLIDVSERRLTFQPRWFFRTLFRRPTFDYPFDSILKVEKSDCYVNIVIARSSMPAITLVLSDREVRLVPRPPRFDEAFSVVRTAWRDSRSH